MATQNVLSKMVGLDEVKSQLKTVVDTYTFLQSRKDVAKVRLSVNAIIIGETGTGKTMLAEVIRDYFYQNKNSNCVTWSIEDIICVIDTSLLQEELQSIVKSIYDL